MGQDLELDLNDKSSVGLSPNTVLPSHQYCLNMKKRYKKVKPTGKDGFLHLKEDFAVIKLARFRSSSCKSLPSRSHGLEGNIEMRRGSMYQSSEEVKNIKKMGTMWGRKKLEISCGTSDASFSGSIVDSLCGSDDEGSEERPSVISPDSNLGSPSDSSSRTCMEHNSSNGYIEFCINSDVWDKNSTAVEGIDSLNSKARSDKVVGALIDGNSRLQKDTIHALQKSLSAKMEVSHLLSPSESDRSSKASPKALFTPIRKRLNPFTRSKSLRSPVSPMLETSEVKSSGTTNVTRNRTYQKSLLNDFSKTAKHSDMISEFINRDIQYSGIACSPVHLHGNLKLENKQGVPFFEFKVKCPEDVFVAKTWRAGNAFNWVYTFHSIDNRKRSNATGLGSHDCDKDLSMVGQMLASCNLCSELEGRVFDNSMVTEFVLYDLTHSRRHVSPSTKKKSYSEQDASKTLKASHAGAKGETFRPDEKTLAVAIKNKLLSGNVDFDNSYSYPFLSTELRSNVEIAAIVLQTPFHKRESLKYRRGDRINANAYSKLSDLSAVVEQKRKSLHDRKIQEQVKVVLPTGKHGLPSDESQGPSSLLDRWKYGGGCDCGGWDMACPLTLLSNPGIEFAEDHRLMEEYQPLELFVEGAKESTPTFSMRIVEGEQYAVDFHAQLSPLQAFSICVAILHGTSAVSGAGQEQNQQLSQCSSLKMLIEEEVEFLTKSVTTDEKKTVSKTQKGIPRCYVVNPPFSPIARV